MFDRARSLAQFFTGIVRIVEPAPGHTRRLARCRKAFPHVDDDAAFAGPAGAADAGQPVSAAQFGSGGGAQYYVSPTDTAKLRPGENVPISRWRLAEGSTR